MEEINPIKKREEKIVQTQFRATVFKLLSSS